MIAKSRPLNGLVVDDDRGVRRAVVETLERAGHRAFEAGSEAEAIEVVRFQPVHFSIVDVHIKSDDGLDVIASLRRHRDVLPVIFMSGAFTPEIVARAKDLGAYRCLDKPLDIRSLLQAVETLIDIENL